MTRIICVIVDTQNLTMYKADGQTIIIPQGDPRIRDLVSKVVPELERKQARGEPVFVDLNDEDFTLHSHYAEAEKSMNGFVKFFRVAKAKLAEIVQKFAEPILPIKVGNLPEKESALEKTEQLVNQLAQPVAAPIELDVEGDVDEQSPVQTRGEAAVAEIMANAASSETVAFQVEDDNTTVVAIVDGKTVIPGVDQIEVQLQALAAKMGSATGVTNFFRRLATVERAHSVADLLKFMEKGELPIADDGTVLVYKRLMRDGDGYVDCHSKKVKQRVGSKVFMAEKLVDPNRSRDCSNGLHIARRDYLSSFSGNVCVLCKLAPEDVIAVPHSDARKLRAKGYFIVAELTQADHDAVTYNKPLNDKTLLGNVMAGNHTAVIETVEITGQYGAGLIITPVGAATEVVMDESLSAQSLDSLPEVNAEAAMVDARDLGLGNRDQLVQTNADEPATETVHNAAVPGSKRRPVDVLVEEFEKNPCYANAKALVDYKKSSKRSWIDLGVAAPIFDKAIGLVANGEPVLETKAVKKAVKPVKVKKADSSSASRTKGKAPTKRADSTLRAPSIPNQVPGKLTQAEQAIKLWAEFKKDPSRTNAQSVMNFKKKAKKGWEALGLSADAGDDLAKHLK
jgi:hypothetical protein